jgi:hypothetical protein
MTMTRHEGGCLCGAIRFEALGTPRSVFHCHCFSCRRQTGAAMASFAAFQISDTFRWTKDEPAAYASSPGVTRKFCARCGTPLSYQAEKYADEIHLNIGCFDRADDLVPAAHWHVEEKLPWFETADDLPRHRGE